MASCGSVRLGKAGVARQCMVWHGTAMLGKAGEVSRGKAGYVEEWQGWSG